ncbi:MAG: hypothetical protein JRD02_02920, partial [Deltaproteobacteria bacterium]|nr:hypothetical protein [Deltaproteobacteria bacterium]
MAASHGVAADKIVADLKRISRGTIDTMTLMEKAGTAMMLGIDPKKIAKLMEIARASTKITGQTVTQAFSDISLAVGRQSKMILDNLGILVSVEEANKKYAEKLKIVGRELTDVERKQAFLNETVEKGGDILARVGKLQDSAAERMQRWQAQWKDVGITIGQVALSVLQSVDLMATGAATAFNSAIRGITYSLSEMFNQAARLPVIGDSVFGAWAEGFKKIDSYMSGQIEWGIKHIDDTWAALFSTWKKSDPVRAKLLKDLRDQAKATKNAGDQIKQLMEMEKSAAKKRADAISTMYKEVGINAEAAAKVEVQKLVKKVSDWQAAGVNILDTNRYLYESLERMSEKATDAGQDDMADYYDTVKNKAKFLVQEFIDTQAEAEARMAKVDASLSKHRALSIDDNASATLTRIKNVLDSIKDKTVRVNIETVQTSVARPSFGVYDSAGNQMKDVEDEITRGIQDKIAEDTKYGRSPITQPDVGWVLTKDAIGSL